MGMNSDIKCVCMRNIIICNCNRPEEIERKESRDCLCGRSVNGKCMSWHAMSEKIYLERKSRCQRSSF